VVQNWTAGEKVRQVEVKKERIQRSHGKGTGKGSCCAIGNWKKSEQKTVEDSSIGGENKKKTSEKKEERSAPKKPKLAGEK